MDQSLFVRLSILVTDIAPVAICVTLECGKDFIWWNRGNKVRSRNQATERKIGLDNQCGTSQGLRCAPVY